MRYRAAGALLAICASCAPRPQQEPGPVQVALPGPLAVEPVPLPTGLGQPWVPPAEWVGPGIPPKQYSLFDVPAGSPVLAYAGLDREACEAELARRGVEFAPAEATRGVLAPIRLAGALHGVAAHSTVPARARAKSQKELIDCRLALALDDFSGDLAARDITDFEWTSAYRTQAELGCTAKYRGEQHCAALAVDVTSFGKRDGKRLVVARDFHGKLGTLTCGAGESPHNELWSIACDAAGKDFQLVLTPNWNADHRDHLHLELTVHDWVLAR